VEVVNKGYTRLELLDNGIHIHIFTYLRVSICDPPIIIEGTLEVAVADPRE